jgi:hypothetical protein
MIWTPAGKLTPDRVGVIKVVSTSLRMSVAEPSQYLELSLEARSLHSPVVEPLITTEIFFWVGEYPI